MPASRIPGDRARLTLRFEIRADDVASLAALCRARREMLLEEQARLVGNGEPSLRDALFTPTEIVWTLRPEQRQGCLRKLDELLRKANQAARVTVTYSSL